MPNLYLRSRYYNYMRGPKGSKPVAGRLLVRGIDHPANNNKYNVVIGIFHPDDINFLGEIIYISRGDTRQDQNYHTSTLDAMARGEGDIRLSVAERAFLLEELRQEVEKLRDMLHVDWPVWREDPGLAEFLLYAFGSQLARLDRARTGPRKSALAMLRPALSLHDKLKRPNPMASVARLVGVQSRLRTQSRRDRISRNSLSNRAHVAVDSLEADVELSIDIDRLLQYGRDEIVNRQLPQMFAKLVAKPFVYATIYSQAVWAGEGLGPKTRHLIAMAFAAERSLLELNGALSVARQTFRLLTQSDIIALAATLEDLDFADSYEQLAIKINDYLTIMAACLSIEPRDSKNFIRAIEQIKHLIRYRMSLNTTQPWSTQQRHDNYNQKIIWVTSAPS